MIMDDDITQAFLLEILHYDPLTGVWTWLRPTGKRMRSGQIAGAVLPMGTGYMGIRINGRRYLSHRLAVLYMTGKWPLRLVDHIDCNGMNNRWENLREATNTNNAGNCRVPVNNTSGAKGVSWHRDAKKWVANIKRSGRQFNLGLYSTVEEAAAAYLTAAKDHFGEFARVR